jgi:hypothetical protein
MGANSQVLIVNVFFLFILSYSMLIAATCNIQDSSLQNEHLGYLEYNGYEGHWWTPNKDPIDLHLDFHICTLQFASLQLLKIYLLHWFTIYVVQNGEWWNLTMRIFLNWLSFTWTGLTGKAWMWTGLGFDWWSLNMNTAQAWALNHKQWFLVLQHWKSRTRIQWCSIFKSSPLHLEMKESSSNLTFWIYFFLCFFVCIV